MKKTRRASYVFAMLVLLPSIGRAAITECLTAPELSPVTGNTVTVNNVTQLENAVSNLTSGTTILIEAGTYQLTTTLYIKASNVVVRGVDNSCDSVELIGKGMENANRGDVGSGIWINSDSVTIANLTVRDTFLHPIELTGGPDSVHIYNVRLLDAGQQFIKASSAGGFGLGSDFGKVEYSIMEYTNGPPTTDNGGGTGYTNGVDVHGGDGWEIRNNVFKNFHTPDTADHLWNPAVLMWNGARNTLTENNLFINVDRAIAYGLLSRSNDHQGGIIRNNMITMAPNLYSPSRINNSDAPIILWSSPNTKVLHNTVRTHGNTVKAIELRFGSSNVEVGSNLTDAPIVYREGSAFTQSNNITSANSSMFVNDVNGDLHLRSSANSVIDKVTRSNYALRDYDGELRPSGLLVDIGADEQSSNVVERSTIVISPIVDLIISEDEEPL